MVSTPARGVIRVVIVVVVVVVVAEFHLRSRGASSYAERFVNTTEKERAKSPAA